MEQRKEVKRNELQECFSGACFHWGNSCIMDFERRGDYQRGRPGNRGYSGDVGSDRPVLLQKEGDLKWISYTINSYGFAVPKG